LIHRRIAAVGPSGAGRRAAGADAAALGRILLGVAVVGMLGYALWSFIEAAYRRI
jgi:hypothetical protein